MHSYPYRSSRYSSFYKDGKVHFFAEVPGVSSEDVTAKLEDTVLLVTVSEGNNPLRDMSDTFKVFLCDKTDLDTLQIVVKDGLINITCDIFAKKVKDLEVKSA